MGKPRRPDAPGLGVGMVVRTDLRAGKEPHVFEAAFFKLLDGLQKPTDWVYERLIFPEPRQPSGGGA